MRLLTCILLMFTLGLGCDLGVSPEPIRASVATDLVKRPTSVVEHAILAFLNDPGTDVDLLDNEVPLDRRAARSLVQYRNGADGLYGTADDRLYTSLGQVDAVYWVGDEAIARLAVYVEKESWIADLDGLLGVYRGVAFTVAEGRCAIDWVNTAKPESLTTARLAASTTAAILATRPIATMSGLAELYSVTTDALIRVRSVARGEMNVYSGAELTSDATR